MFNPFLPYTYQYERSQLTPQPVSVMSGPKCCQNPPTTSSGGEAGKVLQIASLSSYVSGKPDSKIAVLLLSDVFGYEAPKLSFSYKIAAAGYYVVVPDFLFGDYMTAEAQIDDWLKKHAPEQTVKFAKPVIQALKEKGISKIGSAGFWWGAKVVVELAKDAEIIQVAALLHPLFVTLDDIKAVKVPIAILSAEFDTLSPPEFIKEYEAALVANEVYHFVKIYPGVNHGWVVRYNDKNVAEVKSAKEAQQDLVDWFGKALVCKILSRQ